MNTGTIIRILSEKKIKVNFPQSMILQEILFSSGMWWWGISNNVIVDEEELYILLYWDLFLDVPAMRPVDRDTWEKDNYRSEITFSDFLRMAEKTRPYKKILNKYALISDSLCL